MPQPARRTLTTEDRTKQEEIKAARSAYKIQRQQQRRAEKRSQAAVQALDSQIPG